MKYHRFKKALFISAFFIACCLPLAPSACPNFQPAETARVKHVHDGDTLNLSDQRKVRLIGIDTPELARRTKNQFRPAQPYAVKARDFVRQLIQQQGNNVKLMPGQEATDRYGRHLFHIQLADGSLLQSRLIVAGLAVAYTTPPNDKLSDCYQQAEQRARQLRSGFWIHEKYQLIDTASLTTEHKGFHLIKGKVLRMGESKKALWLNFSNKTSARIDKRDLRFFPYPLQQLKDKTVIIKGWIRIYGDKKQISLRHPSALSIINNDEN